MVLGGAIGKEIEELRGKVGFYECMLNSLPVYVFVIHVDEGGDVLSASNVWSNKWMLDAVGCSQKETNSMGGHFLKSICHPDDVGQYQKAFDYVKNNPDAIYGFFSRIKLKDVEGDCWFYARVRSLNCYTTDNSWLCSNKGGEVEEKLHSGVLFAIVLCEMNKLTNEARLKSLTSREREIFKLIVLGFSDRCICEKLFISIATAKTHRNRILRKLQVKNTASLVALGKECGF